jgi:lipopolysaccharide heptosyltransferase II
VPLTFGLSALSLGDRYFLRFFFGLEAVAHYTVGYKIAATLGIPIRAFQVAWPTVLFSAANERNAERLYSRLLTYLMFLLASAGLVVSLFARELIRLLAGRGFESSYVVVPILVLAQLGLGAFYVTAVGSNIKAKTHYQTVAIGCALLVFGALAFLLIPATGIMGAAIATASGYATLAATSCALSLKVYRIAYEWRRVAAVLGVAVGVAALGLALDTGSPALNFVFKLCLVGMYPVLLCMLGIADASERQAVRGLALKMLSRVLLPRRTGIPDPEVVDRVLVYGGMGIGNMIMFTPALRSLRNGFPNARITLLAGASGADEVVRGGDLVDDIVQVGPGLLERLRLALHLRATRYDVLLSAFQGDDFKLVTLFARIPYRVGHISSGGWRGRADFLYNVPVVMDDGEHEVDRKLRLTRALGMEPVAGCPEFYLAEGDRLSARKLLSDAGLGETRLLIGVPVDVSRGQEWKRWSVERLAVVCNELARRHGCEFVLLGAPGSMKDAEELMTSLEFRPFVAIGKASLKVAAGILERCSLTICADSGLMHLSAAVGTPVLAIYGPTDYRRTSPLRYGSSHRVVRKDVECGPCFLMQGDSTVTACSHRKCLGMIQAEELIQNAEEMLGLVVTAEHHLFGSPLATGADAHLTNRSSTGKK